MEPKIIFQDSEILVLDKPAGMTVNKAETTKDETTVQDWLEDYLKVSKDGKASKVSNGEKSKTHFDTFDTFLNRAGIVHRIDKETSGILLVAKTPQAFSNLQSQFKERKVKKTYTALVHGKVEGDGEINVPVGRLPWNRTHFGVIAGGKEAITKFRVQNSELGIKDMPLSLLELYPETGRTHQIRVHLKYIGHPIFADELYAGRKTARNDRKHLSRFFLHASKISFFHPKTNQSVSLESPLPNELQSLLESLKV